MDMFRYITTHSVWEKESKNGKDKIVATVNDKIRQTITFFTVLFSFIIIYYMKKGTLVKLKTNYSEKGYLTGVVIDVYRGGQNIAIVDVYIFEKGKVMFVWEKDLEVMSET
jgi:hypothetical protein